MSPRSSVPSLPPVITIASDVSSPPTSPRSGAGTQRKSRVLQPPSPRSRGFFSTLTRSRQLLPVSPDSGLDAPGPDPHWALAARLYQNGLGALLDDQGDDVQQPLPLDVTRTWAAHLQDRQPVQLSFFLGEDAGRLEAMGLSRAHAQLRTTVHRLTHPVRVPSPREWQEVLSVQAILLEERLCALAPAPMAAWLQQVHETLLRPTADPRSTDDVKLLLRVLAAVTATEVFRSQGWLGGSTETLALRHAVTDLMRDLGAIVQRCPDLDDVAGADLARLAAQVRL